MLALTLAIRKTLEECAPNYNFTSDSNSEISSLIVTSLSKETVYLSKRFFQQPALNPGFVRIKENLLSLLSKCDTHVITQDQIDMIGNKLGRTFSLEIFELIRSPDVDENFGQFLRLFNTSLVDNAINRGWIWDDYRSYLNQLTYRRLFLHELPGHPDVTLPDLYIPSRGISYEKNDENHDIKSSNQKLAQKNVMHVFDIAQQLKQNWLTGDANKVGLSRLITGDPGAGKSTFSLMLANSLAQQGWRCVFIPANSIRSLELSLPKIIANHIMMSLKMEAPPNIDAELADPESTGKPLVIILDGLDEYDVGGVTVSLAAAKLVEHALTVVSDWDRNGYSVRLLLCGRPESATSLTSNFRDPFHHIHVTGFVTSAAQDFEIFDESSKHLLEVDQRNEWWKKWQENSGEEVIGLPETIQNSIEPGVKEITAQPLLNYMLAVLGLYGAEELSNLSTLYGALFAKYYDRQKDGKSEVFTKLCPNLDRFRRIMSEIGIAAWHAGDRSVGTDDLKRRFDSPPLKSWFEGAGKANSGLSAILSAFYTRPEDAASPDSGLAHRYVFTHKSFREYLTAVGVVRFLIKLCGQLDADADDGWSDPFALQQWLSLFGSTSIDFRQWQFIQSEIISNDLEHAELKKIGDAVTKLIGLSLRRKMPIPKESTSVEDTISFIGNAEEALILCLNAIESSIIERYPNKDYRFSIDWPQSDLLNEDTVEFLPTALQEFILRIRSRPGIPDEMLMFHIGCIFRNMTPALAQQLETDFRHRADGYLYAKSLDFSGAKLTNVDFTGVQLQYAKFHRAQLEGAQFSHSDLTGADFSHATISDIDLTDTTVDDLILISTFFQTDRLSTVSNPLRTKGKKTSKIKSIIESTGAKLRKINGDLDKDIVR